MSEKKGRGLECKTIPQDARYYNQNCTNWCFASFVDYIKCTRYLGEGSPQCAELERVYKTLCPNEWIARWYEQIEDGSFPAYLPSKKEDNQCP